MPCFMLMSNLKYNGRECYTAESWTCRSWLSFGGRDLNVEGDERCIGLFTVCSRPSPVKVAYHSQRIKGSLLADPAECNVYLSLSWAPGITDQFVSSLLKYIDDVS